MIFHKKQQHKIIVLIQSKEEILNDRPDKGLNFKV